MTIMECLLVLFALANCWWSVENWRVMRTHENENRETLAEIANIKKAAMGLFRAAEGSGLSQVYKVCDTCKRIVTQHETDAAGLTTCANCAKDRVSGFANGVAISG